MRDRPLVMPRQFQVIPAGFKQHQGALVPPGLQVDNQAGPLLHLRVVLQIVFGAQEPQFLPVGEQKDQVTVWGLSFQVIKAFQQGSDRHNVIKGAWAAGDGIRMGHEQDGLIRPGGVHMHRDIAQHQGIIVQGIGFLLKAVAHFCELLFQIALGEGDALAAGGMRP